ncbi:MAG: hypothetical protein HKP61_20335 [Dactylosporangium sp.]|nr:hypothetical protein [Dactylosporangium sp.]NNJ63233.1 hypothetical protein [Dactylosporangium sp.]
MQEPTAPFEEDRQGLFRPGPARRFAPRDGRDTVDVVEPSHPVDPLAARAPAIPQARRYPTPDEDSPLEFGVATPAAADSPPADDLVAEPTEPTEPEEPAEPAVGTADRPQPQPKDSKAELPKVWHARSVLLIVLAACMMLGAVGIGTFYVLQEQADSRDPKTVVRFYVEAALNNRDSEAAGRYVCRSPELEEIESMMSWLTSWEQERNIRFQFVVSEFSETIRGDESVVDAKIQRRTSISESTPERWRFSLVNESGWRVCGAHKIE